MEVVVSGEQGRGIEFVVPAKAAIGARVRASHWAWSDGVRAKAIRGGCRDILVVGDGRCGSAGGNRKSCGIRGARESRGFVESSGFINRQRIVSIQGIIGEVAEERAVQAVGAALGDDADYTARSTSIFSVGSARGDAKFFDGIVDLEGNGLIGARSNVVRPVKKEIVGAGPLAGDAETC